MKLVGNREINQFGSLPLVHWPTRDGFWQASHQFCEARWRLLSYTAPRIAGEERTGSSPAGWGHDMENWIPTIHILLWCRKVRGRNKQVSQLKRALGGLRAVVFKWQFPVPVFTWYWGRLLLLCELERENAYNLGRWGAVNLGSGAGGGVGGRCLRCCL